MAVSGLVLLFASAGVLEHSGIKKEVKLQRPLRLLGQLAGKLNRVILIMVDPG